MYIFKSIHKGGTTLEDVEKEQIELKKDLDRIKQGDPKDKSPEQKKTINNIKNLYNSREEAVPMFQRTHLKTFMNQNKEQDLEIYLLNKCCKCFHYYYLRYLQAIIQRVY